MCIHKPNKRKKRKVTKLPKIMYRFFYGFVRLDLLNVSSVSPKIVVPRLGATIEYRATFQAVLLKWLGDSTVKENKKKLKEISRQPQVNNNLVARRLGGSSVDLTLKERERYKI